MRRFVRFVRGHQAGAVAAVVVLAVGAIVLTVRLQQRPDLRMLAIKASGYPSSLAELGASYQSIPPERNAALICGRAFALPCFPGETNDTANLSQREWLPRDGAPLKPADLAELEKLLELAAPALELLRSVPPDPQARYPLDFSAGFGMLLPHLPCFKRAMRLFEAEMLRQSARGRTAEAIAAVLGAERVRATLEQEPIFISKLVTLAGAEILVRDIQYLANAHRLTVDELKALRSVTRSSRLEESLAQGLAAERVFGIAVFEDPSQLGFVGGGGAQPNALGRSVLETLKLGGVFSRDRAYYLDQMSNYIHAAEQPFPLRWQLGKATSDNLAPKKYYIISRMLMPSLGRAFTRHAEGVARLRGAQAALAVEAFRRENSESPPASLQTLAPKYLPSVPADPFDGNPLRYRAWADGFVVYSLGSDQVDNGGVPAAKRNTNLQGTNGPPGDICFTVGKNAAAAEKGQE